MNVKTSSECGKLKISEDAVKKIVMLSVPEVRGIAGLSKKKGFLGTSGSVSVKNLGGVVEITVRIIVNQGVNVPAVSVNVQNAVKDNVQSMLGVPVSKVNIIVDGKSDS